MEGRRRFQILDGLRSSHPRLIPLRPASAALPRQGREESPRHHTVAPESGDLAIALKATELRLSSLLEDRTRIGRDLHDCVLQSVYAIGMNLEAACRVSPHVTPDGQASHDGIIEQLNRLIREVRRMIQSLESGTVQEFDLVSELSTLISIYEQAGRLHIELDLQPKAIEILTKEEEQEILNIVREALSNCARHANATRATVSLRTRGARVRVSVSDDGIGFATAEVRHQSYGLANMTARARKIGGTLRVQSTVGRGTHVIAEFPLEPILAPV